MNRKVWNVLAALTIAAPVVVMAQSTSTVTRAQVREELFRMEQANYKPAVQDPNYPSQYQAIAARAAARNAPSQNAGYGEPSHGSSNSGPGEALSQN
ncbi:DUF4148 domain-containing protein [Burkholderia orbicola]|uniref:DUF4148 domain-containing protein n=1 Tax=Burkholderia orbicola TaxID=2978683 RepID=UPI0039A572ED